MPGQYPDGYGDDPTFPGRVYQGPAPDAADTYLDVEPDGPAPALPTTPRAGRARRRYGPVGIAALVAVPLLAIGGGGYALLHGDGDGRRTALPTLVPTAPASPPGDASAAPTTEPSTAEPSTTGSGAPSGAAGLAAAPSPSATRPTQPATRSTTRPPATTRPGGTTTGGTTGGTDQVSRYEGEVLSLVNTERAKAGCGAVQNNSLLHNAARGHSSDMAANNYFSHTSQDGRTFADRIRAAGYTGSAIAENIAWGQSTPQAVMTSWMNSSGHRANILNCRYNALGVGLAYSSDGRPYWTQDFGGS